MEILKTLVLSTGHLPQQEFESINSEFVEFIVGGDREKTFCFGSIEHEYGKIIKIGPDDEPGDQTSASFPSLWKIIQYCRANDITYIDFDQDGLTVPEFESFNW